MVFSNNDSNLLAHDVQPTSVSAASSSRQTSFPETNDVVLYPVFFRPSRMGGEDRVKIGCENSQITVYTLFTTFANISKVEA